MSFRLPSLVLAVLAVGCGGGDAPDPFHPGSPRDAVGGDDAGPASVDGGVVGVEEGPAEPLRGPCVDDAQCDDGIACTFDACDPDFGRCRSTPDDSACEDGVFCDGAERCDSELGCRPGEPFDCSDGTACTIDACDESNRACTHGPRDADGDGDPDINCEDGGDCDERDPRVSSLAPERCDNGVDDDCDGDVDEADCATPEYDTCLDALEVPDSGTWTLDLGPAASDYAASCVEVGAHTRDAVVAIVVPEGAPVDVDIRAEARSGEVQLATVGTCGDASSELGCALSAETPNQTHAARLRLRSPAAGPTALYVFTDSSSPVTLDVQFTEPEPRPTNETCGTATTLEEGVATRVSLVDATVDLATACKGSFGDRVYQFELNEPKDVRVTMTTSDGFGEPSVSLRTEACSSPEDEIVCRTTATGDVFWRGLGPGRYFVSVSATGPTDADILLVTTPPSAAPADESCEGAPSITPNVTVDLDLDGHVDDIRLDCSSGLVDAAYALELTERSDVLVVQRIASGDRGVVALASAACSPPPISCDSAGQSPNRTSEHDLAPGDYRVVAETAAAGSTTLTALVRPARAPVLVAFADDCAGAVDVPADGGFFIGNTANATADYGARCDTGGQPSGGAADQLLRLELTAPKRVVLDMRGSSYATLMTLRQGPDCPGPEVPEACSAGYGANRSYLDVELPAGVYYVQIDGYGGSEGAWLLDVYVVDP